MPYFVILAFFLFLPILSSADSSVDGHQKKAALADGHAPNLVMGDPPMQKENDVFLQIYANGNGRKSGEFKIINPEDIVNTELNRFFGLPGQPQLFGLFLPK